MSRRSEPPSAPPTLEPPLDKQTIRLPDGRQLTYYRFPEEPPRPSSELGPPAADARGERNRPGPGAGKEP